MQVELSGNFGDLEVAGVAVRALIPEMVPTMWRLSVGSSFQVRMGGGRYRDTLNMEATELDPRHMSSRVTRDSRGRHLALGR